MLPRAKSRWRTTCRRPIQGASNLHSDEDMEDKIKVLDPRVQKLIRTYLEVFGELPLQPHATSWYRWT